VIRHAGGRRCEWILENGKRCECTRRLQFDHIQAVALGACPRNSRCPMDGRAGA
jgi:hypothetical protein